MNSRSGLSARAASFARASDDGVEICVNSIPHPLPGLPPPNPASRVLCRFSEGSHPPPHALHTLCEALAMIVAGGSPGRMTG
jgi:hypothetical protein